MSKWNRIPQTQPYELEPVMLGWGTDIQAIGFYREMNYRTRSLIGDALGAPHKWRSLTDEERANVDEEVANRLESLSHFIPEDPELREPWTTELKKSLPCGSRWFEVFVHEIRNYSDRDGGDSLVGGAVERLALDCHQMRANELVRMAGGTA